jgi:hypothetical protein
MGWFANLLLQVPEWRLSPLLACVGGGPYPSVVRVPALQVQIQAPKAVQGSPESNQMRRNNEHEGPIWYESPHDRNLDSD